MSSNPPANKPSGPDVKRRKVIYPEVEVKRFVKDEALTVSQAREFMGFREAKDKEPYLLKGFNENGEVVKITCDYNCRNRPFYPSVYQTLKQAILNKQWEFNGETAIIGKTGLVLDGQHTFMALIQAEYERQFGDGKYHWAEIWKKPITIDKIVVLGISEEDDVVNTINTAKPRSLADVLFRSEFFTSLAPDARNMVARICAQAIGFLWVRTGRVNDIYSGRRCHSESVSFLRHHPKLMDAVRHIFEEDAEKAISNLIPASIAAGLLYLMGSCSSNIDDYTHADEPGDSALDFRHWDKAEEFWVLLGSKDDGMKAVRDALAALVSAEETMGVLNRVAVVIKAWEHYVQGHEINRSDLKLKFVDHENIGVPILASHPTVGGIDLGPRKEQKSAYDAEPEMSDDQLEEAKAEQKRLRQQKDKSKEESRKAKAENLAAKLKTRRAEAKAQKEATAAEANWETNTNEEANGEANGDIPKLIQAEEGANT